MSGLTKRVREVISEEPEGSLERIYSAFEGENIREINKVFERLIRREELALFGKKYRYTPRGPRQGAVQQRIWTAMRNLSKVSWVMSFEDIVLISGASPDYVRRYAAHLVKEKYLSRRRSDGAYVMLNPRQIWAPHWNRRKAEAGKGENHG